MCVCMRFFATVSSGIPSSAALSTWSATNRSRCVAAIRVLIGERYGPEKGWLSSTRELQLVSLQVCNDCRNTLSCRVRVEQNTPRTLWDKGDIFQRLGYFKTVVTRNKGRALASQTARVFFSQDITRHRCHHTAHIGSLLCTGPLSEFHPA